MDGGEQTRIAQNEATFRRVNEAIEPDDARGGERIRFVCECGRLGCTQVVELTRDQYEAVRTDFDRFLLIPGHEAEDVDRVAERHDGYVVVVKAGVAAGIADEEDPRGDEMAER